MFPITSEYFMKWVFGFDYIYLEKVRLDRLNTQTAIYSISDWEKYYRVFTNSPWALKHFRASVKHFAMREPPHHHHQHPPPPLPPPPTTTTTTTHHHHHYHHHPPLQMWRTRHVYIITIDVTKMISWLIFRGEKADISTEKGGCDYSSMS